MGFYYLFLGLCLAGQLPASPLHTVLLPYLYQPWVLNGPRVHLVKNDNGPRVQVVKNVEGPDGLAGPDGLMLVDRNVDGREGPMLSVEPVVVEIETEYTCTTNGSFPDPESCNKYYVCNIMPDGELKEFVFDCAPGLSFHADTGICDWPASEDCRHQVSVVACSTLEGSERTLCQERLNTPEIQPVVIDLETDLECTESGIFADPYSCDKYYSCVDIGGELESFQFDCPPGLLFNAVEGGCDYESQVDCTVQEQIEVDVCAGPDLSEEQRTLCQNNAWKHTDHFRK